MNEYMTTRNDFKEHIAKHLIYPVPVRYRGTKQSNDHHKFHARSRGTPS
jgi:hypothetical protein